MKQIIVEITEDGEVRLETKGFVGKACLQEAQFLKDLIGEEIQRQLVPAYFQQGKTVIKKHLPLCG
jgi:hypothetical protein